MDFRKYEQENQWRDDVIELGEEIATLRARIADLEAGRQLDDAEYKRQTSRIAELEKDRDNLRGFFSELSIELWNPGYLDAEDWQSRAIERGLFVEVPASDEVRAEYDCETMFTWAWSDLASAAVAAEGE